MKILKRIKCLFGEHDYRIINTEQLNQSDTARAEHLVCQNCGQSENRFIYDN